MLSPLGSDPSLSPGLTETSATLDQYFDLDSLLSESTPPEEADKRVLFADDASIYEPLAAMDPQSSDMIAPDLYKFFMQGSTTKSETPFDVPQYTDAAPVVDPHLVQTSLPSVSVSGSLTPSLPEEDAEMDDVDHDDEDAGPDYVESDDEETVRPAAKTRASTRRHKTNAPKQSVAALAMPIDEEHQPVGSSSHGKLPHMAFAVPDYIDRPSPDAYKKMNSKEKRQLRNKISARNFRHRRKEYITTLEEEIASRDNTIAVMRDEMGALRSENGELKRDVSLLRKQFEEALSKFSGKQSGIAESPVPGTSQSANDATLTAPASRRGRSAINLPNMTKDVSPLAPTWGPGGFSGITRNLGVHHTILPERNVDLSGKPRQLNPLLAQLDPANLSPYTGHLRQSGGYGLHDDFSETNPYQLNGAAAEAYRGQLYQKIAHNISGLQQGYKDDQGRRTFTSDFRPAFFSSPASLNFGNPSASAVTTEDQERQEAAFVAWHASSTLFRRMARAFAEAFTGSNSTKQVADVLAGRAHVRVVSTSETPAVDDAELLPLTTQMMGLRVEASDLTRAFHSNPLVTNQAEESST